MEMSKLEKVIEAWEIFRDSNPYEICSGLEFRAIREPEYCMGQMIEDTISLLKEQEDALEQMRLDNIDLRNCNAELMKEQEETELCDRCGRRRVKSNREVK